MIVNAPSHLGGIVDTAKNRVASFRLVGQRIEGNLRRIEAIAAKAQAEGQAGPAEAAAQLTGQLLNLKAGWEDIWYDTEAFLRSAQSGTLSFGLVADAGALLARMTILEQKVKVAESLVGALERNVGPIAVAPSPVAIGAGIGTLALVGGALFLMTRKRR